MGTRIQLKMGWNKNGKFRGNENGKRNCVREPKWDETWGNQSEDETEFRGKEGV